MKGCFKTLVIFFAIIGVGIIALLVYAGVSGSHSSYDNSEQPVSYAEPNPQVSSQPSTPEDDGDILDKLRRGVEIWSEFEMRGRLLTQSSEGEVRTGSFHFQKSRDQLRVIINVGPPADDKLTAEFLFQIDRFQSQLNIQTDGYSSSEGFLALPASHDSGKRSFGVYIDDNTVLTKENNHVESDIATSEAKQLRDFDRMMLSSFTLHADQIEKERAYMNDDEQRVSFDDAYRISSITDDGTFLHVEYDEDGTPSEITSFSTDGAMQFIVVDFRPGRPSNIKPFALNGA